LHTKDKWIQKARAVREDELPIKRVRKIIKKKKKGSNQNEEAPEEQASQSLFGNGEEDEYEDPDVPPEERDPVATVYHPMIRHTVPCDLCVLTESA
jgi:hypothetical protein